MSEMKSVLSIAGSDSCGGAGIQADIKTCCAFHIYASTAITALTAQNTMGVSGIFPVDPEFVGKQVRSVVSDIRPDAVKIGMLGSPEVVCKVAELIRELELRNVVLDPVLVASSGDSLSGVVRDTADAIRTELAPLATLLTPNIPEARELLGVDDDFEDPAPLGLRLFALTGARGVLLKGGHGDSEQCTDYLIFRKGIERSVRVDMNESESEEVEKTTARLEVEEYTSKRIETPNNHGTGCTLSTAIACGLAKGLTLSESVREAKSFVGRALEGGRRYRLGDGAGPLDFFS